MGQVSSQVLQRIQISGSMRCCRSTSTLWISAVAVSLMSSGKAHVLEIERLIVDAARGGRDPVREPARLDHATHERCNERAILVAGEPAIHAGLPLLGRDHVAVGINVTCRERSDAAMKRLVWHLEREGHARLRNDPIPALDTGR